MRKMAFRSAAAAAALLGGVLLAGPVLTQTQSGQTMARYTIDAGTMSGMAGMGAGGGMGAAMSMLRGGGGSVVRQLHLRLGSERSASGTPTADHFLPAGMAMGKSVPLVTPLVARADGASNPGAPGSAELPRGRLLLFWGCGERAGPGQPVVIDFAKMARGQIPPNLYAPAVAIAEQWQLTQASSRTYGEWPNARDSKQVPGKASLIGAHRIASSYAPEIAFDLDSDFMAPLQLRSAKMPSGAYALNWNGVAGATGHYAWTMSAKTGAGDTPDMVWWASSAKQAFGGPMWDWLAPAAVAKLVADKTVMPASRTSCTVPAEVSQAGGEMMMANLAAYGPQRDFSFPARPANARAGWQPEWITRIRFRSNTMAMLGMDAAMAGRGAEDSSAEGEGEAPPKKPKCKGLKGIAMRAAGLCE